MKVAGHRLQGVRYVRSPCQSPRALKQLSIMIHYTAGHTLDGAVRTLTKKETGASAHLVIGRDGAIVQLVDFNRIAWHAGPSTWRGKPKLNDWSIGIELVNLGPLKPKREHLHDPDVHWQELPDGESFAYWQVYPEPQLVALEQAIAALREAYPSIAELVGHEHVCIPAGRKRDPGPAFPWQRFGGEPPQDA